jgi:hypothetical protein
MRLHLLPDSVSPRHLDMYRQSCLKSKQPNLNSTLSFSNLNRYVESADSTASSAATAFALSPIMNESLPARNRGLDPSRELSKFRIGQCGAPSAQFPGPPLERIFR